MAENGKKPGKLGLAILENLVESRQGGEFVKEDHAPTAEQKTLTEAMQKTADRLWKDWADKHIWNALFSHLPRNRKSLADLKPALESFYQHPTDTGFAGVLTEILQTHNHFPPEIIQKAVGEYITTLTEELIVADDKFRENARGQSDTMRVGVLPRVEKVPASQNLPKPEEALDKVTPSQPNVNEMAAGQQTLPSRKVLDIFTPRQLEEGELQVALARLNKLPEDRIPKLVSLPKDSRFPSFRPNQLFVGRKEELKQLAVWLKRGDTVAICQPASAAGMGGIGKTQLACAFAQRYAQYFTGGVFWLNFAQPELIPSELAACGGPADAHPLETRVKQVLSDWQDGIPRLLIFDNCEDPQLLVQWRPPTGASRVLVTSRLSTWDPGLGIQTLPLGLLERPESVALLRGFREDLETDDPDLDAIAGDLEDMPLALQMAGSFLRTYRQSMNPGEYLKALRQPELLMQRPLKSGGFSPSGHDLAVERAFAVGVEWLQKERETNRLALDLLKQIACFASGEFIPRELLSTIVPAGRGDNTVFEDGVNRLLGMGLVEDNSQGDLRMHWLVASFVRDTLPGKGALLAQVDQAVLSAAAKANHSGNLSNMWPVLAHLKQLTDQALKNKHELAARLANELGYYLEAIADYPGARSYYKQALAFNQQVLGDAHPDTTASLNNLGGLLDSIGDHAGARPYYEKALLIRRKVLGSEHPDTARSLNNMGHLLQVMGDYSEARPYYEQALAARRKALGEEHPGTVTSLNNLGGLLQAMGDYPGARSYYEQALAINRRVLGEEHPGTASSLTNLGGLLQAMGDYPDARSYYEQALAINRKALGKQHPGTASSLNNMGRLLQAMGDYAGARSFFEQALVIRRKVLGQEHPETAASLNNQGELLQALGDYSGARPFFEQSLAIRRKVLGEEHPATVTSLNNLGNLLLALGDVTGAQPYLEQAQVINQKVQVEKQSRNASGFNFLKYSMRAKVALAVLFLLSFGVIGWQAFAHQGLTSTALYGLVPTPNQTGVFQFSDLFPGLVSTSARSTSQRRTATPTRTPTMTFTSTRTPTITRTPTAQFQSGGIGPINTPVLTNTSVPTRTRVPPTAIPPTAVPPTSVPPTSVVPSATPTFGMPTVATPPTDTPSGPTPTTAPPTATPVPPTATLPVTPLPSETPIP